MFRQDQSGESTDLKSTTTLPPSQCSEFKGAPQNAPGEEGLGDHSADNSRSHLIDICGPIAWISPPADDLVAPILSCSTPRVRRGRTGGVEVVFDLEQFFGFSADGRLWTLSGFVDSIRSALVHAGRSVEIRQPPGYSSRKAPDREVIGRLATRERQYAEVILQRQRSQFVVDGKDALSFMDTTCRLFPASRILIVARKRRRIRQIHRYLQSRRTELVCVVGGGAIDNEAARIQIVPVHHFFSAISNPAEVDIVLLDDAGRIANARQSFDALARIRNQHVYGFKSLRHASSRSELLWLEGVCGPVFSSPVSSGALGLPPVRTVFLTPPECAAPSHADALGRKRAAIWHSQRRNQLIAGLARALADSHHVALMQMGLVDIEDYYFARLHCPLVAILVESVEHARALARLLPSWPVGTLSAAGGVGDLSRSRHCIVTLLAARHYQALYVDAIVNATGVAPCELPTLVHGSYGFPPEILLIDLADDYDRAARDHARNRAHDYSRRGWIVDHPPARHPTCWPKGRHSDGATL